MPQNFCAEMLAGSFARRRISRLYMRALRDLSRPGRARFTADRHDIRSLYSRHHHAMYRAGVRGMAMGDAHKGALDGWGLHRNRPKGSEAPRVGS